MFPLDNVYKEQGIEHFLVYILWISANLIEILLNNWKMHRTAKTIIDRINLENEKVMFHYDILFSY